MAAREPDEIIKDRLQSASEHIDLVKAFQPVADEVDGWWADHIAEDEVDRRILAWAQERDYNPRNWVEEELAAQGLTGEQLDELTRALQVDGWLIACVKSIARDGKPIPFYPFLHGDAFVQPAKDETPAMVWALATPVTDPKAVAEKFIRLCRETFGEQVLKHLKDEDELAVWSRMHDMGMSYRDIAVQSLRKEIGPDIVKHPHRYRARVKQRRELVIKRISAFRRLWNERLPEDSTG